MLIVARQWLEKMTGKQIALSSETEKLMLQHPWPGNFREFFIAYRQALVNSQRGAWNRSALACPQGQKARGGWLATTV
ncbi:hypothetical protein EG19_02760 [Thermoanaerobaculum aquaticum]|uniref:NorR-like AAA+ ATPase lid domain-containing protein n=1 Tax=Thermoanaerobaculum aquaticum TaxID=1312852 RepID=A0A062XZ16_9BACT|nr:hypothetical protein EG19_02760 [Thermoanaerobaculum aquaticum]